MSSRADTILRIARTRGAQTLSSEIGLLRVVWRMRVSTRWRAAALHMDTAEGWIIGAAIDKTFAPAQKLVSVPVATGVGHGSIRPADRETSVPWRKQSDGRKSWRWWRNRPPRPSARQGGRPSILTTSAASVPRRRRRNRKADGRCLAFVSLPELQADSVM